jgi:hypothetical protein
MFGSTVTDWVVKAGTAHYDGTDDDGDGICDVVPDETIIAEWPTTGGMGQVTIGGPGVMELTYEEFLEFCEALEQGENEVALSLESVNSHDHGTDEDSDSDDLPSTEELLSNDGGGLELQGSGGGDPIGDAGEPFYSYTHISDPALEYSPSGLYYY